MHTDDFDYLLPPGAIAQAPLGERDASRLLHVDRRTGQWVHRTFRQLPTLLRRGDLLVFNDTRVIPARLLGHKVGSGGRVELLLVRPVAEASTPQVLAQAASGTAWLCLGQASKAIRPGAELAFEGDLNATVEDALGEGAYRVRFTSPLVSLEAAIARAGRLPLPPYIDRPPSSDDEARYQTVFAQTKGSVAAPTAGLHFTPATFEALAAAGIQVAFVTLEVGPGTFLPVREGDVAAHKMHVERYRVPPETAAQVGRAKAEGRRVVAVGTTVTRTLEAAWEEPTGLRPGPGETALFLVPGATFRVVDALFTNFHLPKSTLLMLVSAFGGRQATLAAYREAAAQGYRFFSYGDAMFIEDFAP